MANTKSGFTSTRRLLQFIILIININNKLTLPQPALTDAIATSPISSPSKESQLTLFHCTTDISLVLSSRPTDPLQPPTLTTRKCLALRVKSSGTWLCSLLILSGGLETNPGPPRTFKYPCGACAKPCMKNQAAVMCDTCEKWTHLKCTQISAQNFKALSNPNASWHCCNCGIPEFNSSLFDDFRIGHLHLPSPPPFPTPLATVPPPPPPYPSPSSPPPPSTPQNRFQTLKVSSPKASNNAPPQRAKPKPFLTSLVINFNSIWNKIHVFASAMAEDDIDIIFATETHLNGEKDAELELGEYNLYRRDRPVTGKPSGGVMIGIKKTLDSELVSKGDLAETIFCKINQKGKPPLIVACAYRPTDNNSELSAAIAKDILDSRSKFKTSDFYMGGDLNLPGTNWETSERGKGYNKEIYEDILDACNDAGLSQTVDEPTRKKNILDVFLTNNPLRVTKTTVVSGLSDHEAVRINISLRLNRKKVAKRLIRLWKKVDLGSIKRDTRAFATLFTASHKITDPVDHLWKCVKKHLDLLIELHVPSKFSSSKLHKPWINTETKRLIRQKQRWYSKAKFSDLEKDWTKYAEIKKLAQKVCRKTQNSYIQDLISDDKDNKKFWSHVRSKQKDSTGIADLRSGETLIQNPREKANIFNTFFCQVFSTPDPHYLENVVPEPKHHMPHIKVKKAGVLKLLENLKPNKATGPDGIPGNLLRMCASELASVFTLLFQASLDQGAVPSDWKLANIVPVFKKGDKAKAQNYRPISLTSISSKILEHIIHSSIMDHFEKHSMLNSFQHGFRQRHSCETQLITTIRDFANGLNSKSQIDAILLDFAKAFDKVDHDRLMTKLSVMGIGDSLHQWIRSFLSNRSQSVLVDGETSSPAAVLSGVPQGTVLGPLLFLVYINDISDKLSPGTVIRLFADDSLIYRIIRNATDAEILQKDLKSLETWAKANKMEFHPDKCQVLRITNRHKPVVSSYNIYNVTLAVVESAKYLGVIIDNKLSWSAQISAACRKSSSTLAFLRRNFYFCPRHVKERCVSTLVRPTLEYGCSVWDPHHQNQIDDLEKVQRRAARFVTGNYTMEHGNTKKNLDLLNWPPLASRRTRAKLHLLHRAQSKSIELPLDDLVWEVSPPKTRNRTNTKLNFPIPHSTVDSHKFSFFPNTIRSWNKLPEHIKANPSLPGFKKSLGTITLTYKTF